MRITTNQGPSANNQTSLDHSHDPNQKARQPTTREVMKADGLDLQSEKYVTLKSKRDPQKDEADQR